MEHPRTTTARDHDDSDMIENIEDAPSFAGTAGGQVARRVASENELDAVAEPEATSRVRKGSGPKGDIAYRPDRSHGS
jgi:hypothetical protein